MTLLSIKDVSVDVGAAERPILKNVTLHVDEGEALGLVGESGSGKSMTLRTVLRMLPDTMKIRGSVELAGESVLDMGRRRLTTLRRREVALIFQDPRASVNPVWTVGDYLVEGLRYSRGLRGSAARREAEKLLDEVGIDRASTRMDQYPQEFSGGMLQRVVFASAVGSGARLILADEPTTALDVSVQSEVLLQLEDLRRHHQLGLVFVTHDLDLAVAMCERIAVMYAGSIVEERPANALYDSPRHPYTAGLIACRPSVESRVDRLPIVPGSPDSAATAPAGCAFSDRCVFAIDRCRSEVPARTELPDGYVHCHRTNELGDLSSAIAGASHGA